MKHLILLAFLTFSSEAQTPFVSSTQRATNSVSLTITEVYEQAQVSVMENGQLVHFQPTVRLVSRMIITNAPVAAQAPKPLLSAQPGPTLVPKQKVAGPQSLDSKSK